MLNMYSDKVTGFTFLREHVNTVSGVPVLG